MLKLSWWVSFCYKNWLNIPLTIFFNFYSLPLKQAVKLPIWLYGRPKLLEISGNIRIDASLIRIGMIKINRSNESAAHSGGNTEIINKSRITFRGNANIGTGCRILVYAGELICGSNIKINNRNYISCSLSVIIGESTAMGNEIQVSDTDFHYLFNLQDSTVSKNSKPVIIGAYNWIGSRTSVMKGTITPEYTTIASNSLLNKIYQVPNNSILAGCPAKNIKTGYKRIKQFHEECCISAYFMNNPDENLYFYNQENIDDAMFHF
jgi:Acetyltransferase (isoleucine patch superfamily)